MEKNDDTKLDDEAPPQVATDSARGMIIAMAIVAALFALLIGWEIYYQAKT